MRCGRNFNTHVRVPSVEAVVYFPIAKSVIIHHSNTVKCKAPKGYSCNKLYLSIRYSINTDRSNQCIETFAALCLCYKYLEKFLKNLTLNITDFFYMPFLLHCRGGRNLKQNLPLTLIIKFQKKKIKRWCASKTAKRSVSDTCRRMSSIPDWTAFVFQLTANPLLG